MGKYSTFLLIGCDDNGIHTEAFTDAEDIYNACVAFTIQDMGPIKFMEVAAGFRDAGDINNGDLAILETAKDTGKIEVGEITRYKELIDMVSDRIGDLASLVFNFGQHAEGTSWDGQKHNNYVDGDSVSQWKIYQITPRAEALFDTAVIETYPHDANEHVLIRREKK